MRATRTMRIGAAMVAVLAWAALIVQFWLLLRATLAGGGHVGEAVVVFFGYFTVLSNLLVALNASAIALAPGARLASPMLRGCATTAIVLVGVGYHLLLRDDWDPQGWQRVADHLLHDAVPAASLAFWLIAPPREALPRRAPLRWALYPVLYLAYVLIRGALIAQFPYPFIDVAAIGYRRTFVNAAGLLAVFVAAGAVLRAAAHRR